MAKRKSAKLKQQENNTMKVVGLAALAGIGYFLATGNSLAAGQPAGPALLPATPAAPTPVTPARQTTLPKTPAPTVTPPKPTASQTTTAPPPVVAQPTTTQAAHEFVFVDSWNGEGIFEGVSDVKTLTDGHGKNRIYNLVNKEYVGTKTGRRKNGMIEVFHKIGEVGFNYWIEEAETVSFRYPGMVDFLERGGGRKMGSYAELMIKTYFTRKYQY